MTPVRLPNVTLCIIDTVNYGDAMFAIKQTLKQITPARVIFFTDVDINVQDGVEIIRIKHLFSAKAYSQWMIKELGKQDITTSHILVIQWDGYVLDGSQWNEQFLEYSWIGATWQEVDLANVGNGGFSLREFRLHQLIAHDPLILPVHPEDTGISRIYRNYLEQKYGLTWAPEELANTFSFELNKPRQKTFGFHQFFHKPYNKYVVIRRYAAMGDVIQVEPVLRYFHEQGYNVALDSPLFYHFFGTHDFPVIDYAKMDKTIEHRIINLDMSYEMNPRQLHLKTYFETCGITDYKLSNPRLNWHDNPGSRIFKKYVVIHIDRRETTHRNQYGIDWRKVRYHMEDQGYTVIQIGANEHENAGIEFNTSNPSMLLWLIGGCSAYIGIDSGPANIAVALGKKCVLFFGAVNPEYIYADMSTITPMYSKCPIATAFCWHEVDGVRGQDCAVDKSLPPCCVYDTDLLISNIDKKL